MKYTSIINYEPFSNALKYHFKRFFNSMYFKTFTKQLIIQPSIVLTSIPIMIEESPGPDPTNATSAEDSLALDKRVSSRPVLRQDLQLNDLDSHSGQIDNNERIGS